MNQHFCRHRVIVTQHKIQKKGNASLVYLPSLAMYDARVDNP